MTKHYALGHISPLCWFGIFLSVAHYTHHVSLAGPNLFREAPLSPVRSFSPPVHNLCIYSLREVLLFSLHLTFPLPPTKSCLQFPTHVPFHEYSHTFRIRVNLKNSPVTSEELGFSYLDIALRTCIKQHWPSKMTSMRAEAMLPCSLIQWVHTHSSPSECEHPELRISSDGLQLNLSMPGTGSLFPDTEAYTIRRRRDFFKKKNIDDKNLGSKVNICLKWENKANYLLFGTYHSACI